MGDCNFSLLYNGPKCSEKICKYAGWCPTCDRNPPVRRRRSRSETTEFCRRKCREMKTFTPQKYSSQQHENMELDYDYKDYYYEPKDLKSDCSRIRANLCELPTTYISNNCQSNSCNLATNHPSKTSVDSKFVACVQKNVKTYEHALKFADDINSHRENLETMTDKSRSPKLVYERELPPIKCDLERQKYNYETLKSPARPLCLPVQKTQALLRSKYSPKLNCKLEEFHLRSRDFYSDNHHNKVAFVNDHQNDHGSSKLDNHYCSHLQTKSLLNHPSEQDRLCYDTCTFFDKKIDTSRLREDYHREMQVLREKLITLKKSSYANAVPKVQPVVPQNNLENAIEIITDVNSSGDLSKGSNIKTTAIRKKGISSPSSVRNMKPKVSLKTRGKVPTAKLRKTKSKNESDNKSSDISETECSASDESEEEPELNEESSNVTSELSNGDSGKSSEDLAIGPVAPSAGDFLGWPVRPSLFPNIPPYIRFTCHDSEVPVKIACGRKYFQWKLSTITPLLVRKTVTNSGFSLVRKSNRWMGTWGKHMKSPGFQTMKESQKLNHFPGTFQLGRKDRLWRNFQKAINKFGSKEFGFLPHTYVLPQELRLLKQNWEFKNGAGGEMWIIKPPASARGVGIKVINKWSQLPKKTSLVIQKYISNPYLINDSKFDLRLYVLVTSFNPLRIYLYPEGLARFASAKYSDDAKDLKDRYMHLTNYSINRLSSQYTPNEDADACQGHKWTLSRLFQYMSEERGVDTKVLWKNLEQLVIKTMITCEAPIVQLCKENILNRYNCYELFGIDVLLDEKLKPWLLEVNISPSLHSSSPLDSHVKGPMVQTLFDIAQFHFPSKLGRSVPQSPQCYDPRQYTINLTKKERHKQVHFTQLETRDDYIDDILENLTGDDVRHLTQAEDEFTVKGKFSRIFPTSHSHKHLQFLEARYYNRLFDAWETKYENNRQAGITRLQDLCAEKVHLKVPPKSKVNKNLPDMTPAPESIQPSVEGQSCPLAQVMQEVTISTNNNPSSN